MKLTNEELQTVDRHFPTHLGRPVIAVLVQRLISEVYERRARDLTSEESRSLKGLQRYLSHPDINGGGKPDGPHAEWAALLDRLLAARGEK